MGCAQVDCGPRQWRWHLLLTLSGFFFLAAGSRHAPEAPKEKNPKGNRSREGAPKARGQSPVVFVVLWFACRALSADTWSAHLDEWTHRMSSPFLSCDIRSFVHNSCADRLTDGFMFSSFAPLRRTDGWETKKTRCNRLLTKRESVWKQRNLGIEGDVVSCLYEFFSLAPQAQRRRTTTCGDISFLVPCGL